MYIKVYIYNIVTYSKKFNVKNINKKINHLTIKN